MYALDGSDVAAAGKVKEARWRKRIGYTRLKSAKAATRQTGKGIDETSLLAHSATQAACRAAG